ncbi:hypothetical protein SAMN05216348_102177 [Olsenella sp. KH3B4]|uniref:ATP-binding protein n=1 Tax=Olsenella sp. KH3B4 TaxID=1855394 RepID=UPI0008C738AB|nr:DUF4143 domain-containing protein [Olsenella sp. KH3B4]SES74631.1 hypothetical protein SAMN05216348_102177 [Olsenella sp. KH3B4]
MKRNAMSALMGWKSRSSRKPLLVYGARQVGKSYLIKEFAKAEFDDYVFLDLERQAVAREVFDGDLDPNRVISNIEQVTNHRIDPHRTLIFFDEIQAAPRALAALKYICEELPDSYVVAAGSLLGVAVNRIGFSAPVGKVETLTLLPMTFDEWLEATGHGQMIKGISEAYARKAPYPLHEQALDFYRTYVLTGGMPEAVASYAEHGDFADVSRIQRDILDLYVADMAKYAEPIETARIREAWLSVPAQLAKENHKFQYKVVRSGGRASQYSVALDWLETAGLVNRCVRISSGQVPLKMQEDRSSFKIYLADTGLLSAMMEIPPAVMFDAAARKFLDAGALTENYVAQNLVAGGFVPRYWTSGRTAEVDFVIEDGGAQAVPVEVKSSDNVRSRSLSVYREKYEPVRTLRLSTRNFGMSDGIESIPLYAAFCLKKGGAN